MKLNLQGKINKNKSKILPHDHYYSEKLERSLLAVYLGRALGIPEHTPVEKELTHYRKEKKVCPLSIIDDNNYVLTLDYTLKMLNINERCECGVPVIIEGETGVGKTELLEMLSKLWNHSWTLLWDKKKAELIKLIKKCRLY